VFTKRSAEAPRDFFSCEAAGLQWLSAAGGGVPCARVIAHDDTSLSLEWLVRAAPTRVAAHEFGLRLARTHDAGADAFGAPPDGWTGPGYFGPMQQPLPMSYSAGGRWGRFYANERLAPMADRAATRLDAFARNAIEAVIARCDAGDFDDDDPPARLHGDLWSGNVMWTPDGAVLIDPAAHGGHRETDLAMLALFGCPHSRPCSGAIRRSGRCAKAGGTASGCTSSIRCWRTSCFSAAGTRGRRWPLHRAR